MDLLCDIQDVELHVLDSGGERLARVLPLLREQAVLSTCLGPASERLSALGGAPGEQWAAAVAAAAAAVAERQQALDDAAADALAAQSLEPSVAATLESVLPHLYRTLLAPPPADELQQLRGTVAALQLRVAEAEAAAADALPHGAADALAVKLDAAQEVNGELRRECATLLRNASEAEARTADADSLAAQLAELRAEVAAREAALMEVEGEATALCGAVDALTAQNAALEGQRATLEAEARQLRWHVAALTEDAALLGARSQPPDEQAAADAGAAEEDGADAAVTQLWAAVHSRASNRYDTGSVASPPPSPRQPSLRDLLSLPSSPSAHSLAEPPSEPASPACSSQASAAHAPCSGECPPLHASPPRSRSAPPSSDRVPSSQADAGVQCELLQAGVSASAGAANGEASPLTDVAAQAVEQGAVTPLRTLVSPSWTGLTAARAQASTPSAQPTRSCVASTAASPRSCAA